MNSLPSRRVYWDAWWELMDRLGAFPKWLRVADFSDPEVATEEGWKKVLGADWVTLAVVAPASAPIRLWGYYLPADLDDLPRYAPERRGVTEPPKFLLGMEE